MNVITLASRKGGVGKSTLTAHLAAYAHLAGRRCMVVDADPQGSLTLWHSMRADNGLVLQSAAQGINRLVASALLAGYEWVFIDTAPTTWLVVQEAIRAATMVVIPVRPGFFDLAAVRETVATARELNKPYAVVINAAPVPVRAAVRPGMVGADQPAHRISRLARRRRQRRREPWRFRLQAGDCPAVWSAIERSVDAINRAQAGPGNTKAA
jgi:chromosome partitioning protein